MSKRLPESATRDFYETGYAILPKFFAPSEIESLRRAFEELHAQAQSLKLSQTWRGSFFVLGPRKNHPGETSVHRVVWCAAADSRLDELGKNPRLVNAACELLGTDSADQLISQAHFKMPRDGVAFDWHQDVQHREKRLGDWTDVNGRGSYVQTLLCLDEMNSENGPLLVVPGSCQKGRIQSQPFSYGQGGSAGGEMAAHPGAVSVTASAGDLILLNPYTLHGSLPNESSQARRIFINGYAAPGANRRLYPGLGSGRRLHASRPS